MEISRLIALLESHGIEWRQPTKEVSNVREPELSRLFAEEKVHLFRRMFRGVLADRQFDYTAGQRATKAGLELVNLTQQLIALPVGLVLLWAAWWLHRKIFWRPGERMSVIDIVVLVLMVGMGLLIALSLWTALG